MGRPRRAEEQRRRLHFHSLRNQGGKTRSHSERRRDQDWFGRKRGATLAPSADRRCHRPRSQRLLIIERTRGFFMTSYPHMRIPKEIAYQFCQASLETPCEL